MDKTATFFDILKGILRHSRNPVHLDEHPWTQSLFVQDALACNPGLTQTNPGQQLMGALTGLFQQLQPPTPPRKGLRLDSRWGEFGLLAALYFTPFNHGTPFPSSQRDAWSRIDPAILYFVYGKPAKALDREAVEKYKLVGDELEFGSASTLSDWHKKGLQRFTEVILNRERYLSRTLAKSSSILQPEGRGELGTSERVALSTSRERKRLTSLRSMRLTLVFALLVVIGLVVFKIWKIYSQGSLLYEQATRLQALIQTPLDLEDLKTAGPLLASFQGDLAVFRREARPLFWLSPALGWVPVYGGDLAYAPELSTLADNVVAASILTYGAAQPLLEGLDSQDSNLDPGELTALLVQAQPGLGKAREALDRALSVRESIHAERLSSRLQVLLVEDIDPLLELADQDLSLATALPAALGASAEGPKTYLLLVQNEDELRPTGGFITSVGNLVLHNGQVISLSFEQVNQEDWSRPYPAAPWQLNEYMNSRVLILRDSNWFSNFPTSAQWAEYLYAYTHEHSVDGIFAFDQHFLVMLLGQLGPLEVDGAPYPITHENVISYMRTAKIPPPGEPIPAGWDRKGFIDDIASAILLEINSGSSGWRGLAEIVSHALTERHLLLQFDDAGLATLLAKRGWDNAVQPSQGDFLMLTDTNIGYNKTNALVDVSLSYEVDLRDLVAPEASLTVTHVNHADPGVPCVQWSYQQSEEIEVYPMNRCYWNYLRVYKQEGVALLEASPHAIPGDWMLLGRGVPARVDELEEGIPGVQGFGTLLVVPGGQPVQTGFRFALPSSVLSNAGVSGQVIYLLKVQKQPGTLANPLTLRIHLPTGASLISASMDAIQQDNDLLVETDLRTDVSLEIVFSFP
jgi:hypothetical protein